MSVCLSGCPFHSLQYFACVFVFCFFFFVVWKFLSDTKVLLAKYQVCHWHRLRASFYHCSRKDLLRLKKHVKATVSRFSIPLSPHFPFCKRLETASVFKFCSRHFSMPPLGNVCLPLEIFRSVNLFRILSFWCECSYLRIYAFRLKWLFSFPSDDSMPFGCPRVPRSIMPHPTVGYLTHLPLDDRTHVMRWETYLRNQTFLFTNLFSQSQDLLDGTWTGQWAWHGIGIGYRPISPSRGMNLLPSMSVLAH